MEQTGATIVGQEHWTHKGDVKLFLWEKRAPVQPCRGTIIFVHGSSMASTPAFDRCPASGLLTREARRLPKATCTAL